MLLNETNGRASLLGIDYMVNCSFGIKLAIPIAVVDEISTVKSEA